MNCQYKITIYDLFFLELREMKEIKSEPLKIKRRGEDGTRVISVRLREEILNSLDNIANDIHYSRNELINIILEHGINNLEIE